MITPDNYPALPSPGRALGVLVAVVAVQWLWTQWPEWCYSGIGNRQQYNNYNSLVHNEWVWLILPVVSNWFVFQLSTKPLWNSARYNTEETKRSLVLKICVLFHVATLVPWLFLCFKMVLCAVGDCSFQ
ncbi:hypothetical protein [uncultured Hymenobacter sp.]|uniref:hypothetical protein n=1 Tax=uncultured Hymenobacter sp. TaxID=170016 RepID=UPI0035CBC787